MALDFPDSPTDGQIFSGYTYNSAVGVWRAPSRETLSGLSDVTIGSRKDNVTLQYLDSAWQARRDYKIIDIIRLFGTTSAAVTQSFSIGDYPDAIALYIQSQGGGGGGGGAATTSASNAVGAGGGGGEYSELFLDITSPTWLIEFASNFNSGYASNDRIPATITMQAGRGGAAGAAGAGGGAGSDSYFWFDNKDVSQDDEYWAGAEGGSGGAAGTSLATNRFAVGAAGGNDPANNGANMVTFNTPGSSGEATMILGATTVNLAASGRGGMSRNSPGAPAVILSAAGGSNGTAAGGWGGGGSGGVNTGTQATARTGGAGSPGFLFVYVLG